MTPRRVTLVCAVLGFLALGSLSAAATGPKPAPAARAQRYSVDEARTAVQMLADFYRHNLRDTHATYVRDGKPPAAIVTKKVFGVMNSLGWPETRWLAVNGNPANRDNLPRDAFETDGARAVRHGEALFEKVEGGRFRAVAAVPFTGDCLKCHWGEKPNEYVGGISFSVPLR